MFEKDPEKRIDSIQLKEKIKNVHHTVIYKERYKLLETIGQGSQAIVYKIEDLKDNNKM